MTPGGPQRQAIRRIGAVPTPAHGEDSYRLVRFRGLIATASRSLSTLRALKFVPATRVTVLPTGRARLASGWWPTFTGWGWVPTRLRYKVSRRAVSRSSLSSDVSHGPPNAADKRTAPRRAGGTRRAGRAGAAGARLAAVEQASQAEGYRTPTRIPGRGTSKPRDRRGAPEPRTTRDTGPESGRSASSAC